MKTKIAPALLAGFLAALILTIAQIVFVTPLILKAETYENAPVVEAPEQAADHAHADAHEHAGDHESAPADQPAQAADHHHDEEAWAPEDGWQRTLSTASANLVMGVGYALILVGLFQLRAPQSANAGLLWGLAGYVTLFAAPSLGLHPELPGTVAAELSARQTWWVATAFATAGGLALGAFARPMALKMLGVLLIAVPHIIGAPQPAVPEALAPLALQQQFIVASAVANAMFWLALGFASAWLYRRANASANSPTTA
ncbi:MAG: CbtA family protein [Pseudomonadales bacterium]|nr:CbtA family protein [Pseudomonadales bacterium]